MQHKEQQGAALLPVVVVLLLFRGSGKCGQH
jgi:hypothetical protein